MVGMTKKWEIRIINTYLKGNLNWNLFFFLKSPRRAFILELLLLCIEMDCHLLQFPRKCGENKLVKKLKSWFSTSFNFLFFFSIEVFARQSTYILAEIKSFVFVHFQSIFDLKNQFNIFLVFFNSFDLLILRK
jgi:hypothetical protein